MTNDDSGLNSVFQRYRAACPEVEPSARFMPGIWQKIEARHSFRFVFEQFAKPLMAGSAALALLLLVLNLMTGPHARLASPSYVDALMADHSAERTYYTEALRNTPAPIDQSGIGRH